MRTVVYVCYMDDIPDDEKITDEIIIKYGTEMELEVFEVCFNCDNGVNQEDQMIKFITK